MGVVILALLIAGIAAASLAPLFGVKTSQDSAKQPTPSTDKQASSPQPTTSPMPYTGQEITTGDFMVKVPNGWRASVSTQSSFLAVMFARPAQLESLVYDPAKPAAVDYNGIPAWGGLTEHFYIRQMTAPSQNFNPANHAEVTSEQFTFDDGTVGTKYVVTKHASEAAKWGGLLKDDVWYGRVFVYESDGKRVEAHLAFYPSTAIDEDFYQKVARSIHMH